MEPVLSETTIEGHCMFQQWFLSAWAIAFWRTIRNLQGGSLAEFISRTHLLKQSDLAVALTDAR